LANQVWAIFLSTSNIGKQTSSSTRLRPQAKQSEFLRTIRTGIEEPQGKSPEEAQKRRNL